MAKRIQALNDTQLKKGCYQPAHEETIKWRTGWRNGFVKRWRSISTECTDHCFAEVDGWEQGYEAGKRDATNDLPAHAHRKGKRIECPSPFRVAWRLGWYRAYYEAGGCGDKLKHGCGYGTGMMDASELLPIVCKSTRPSAPLEQTDR